MTDLPSADPSAARYGPEVTVRVGSDGTLLETGDGQPLYYFIPARLDPRHDQIPYGSSWPFGIRDWIVQWPPLLGNPQPGRHVQARDLSQRDRRGDPDYPGHQVTFRGWPLYTCGLVRASQTLEVPGLWRRASLDLLPLSEAAEMTLPLPAEAEDPASQRGPFGPPWEVGGP